MNYPAASYGVSETARNEASFREYDPERFKFYINVNIGALNAILGSNRRYTTKP
jgi:hypothetical protein